MVRGSRFIPALFGEIEVNSVRQMQHAKKNTHNAISHISPVKLIGHSSAKQSASSHHKAPTEQSHPPWHEKTCSMKCASIQNNPPKRQPQHSQHISDVLWRCSH